MRTLPESIWVDWIKDGLLSDKGVWKDSWRIAAIIYFKNPTALDIRKRQYPIVQLGLRQQQDDVARKEERDDASSTCSVVTQLASSPEGLYVVLDKAPGDEYTKLKDGISNPGYLFGRSRRADIALDSGNELISRNQLLMRLHREVWVLENLANPVRINGTNLTRNEVLALHPQGPNFVEIEGGTCFHIYCCDPREFAFFEQLCERLEPPFMSALVRPKTITSPTQAAQEPSSWLTPCNDPIPMVLYRCPLRLKGGQAYLALDPVTCSLLVAKEHPEATVQQLEIRQEFLDTIPPHERLIKTSLVFKSPDETVFEANPWLDVISLEDNITGAPPKDDQAREMLHEEAIATLYGGLSLLGHLQKNRIAHRDVSTRTVFLPMLSKAWDDVFLAGLSECTSVAVDQGDEPFQADCLALFQTISRYCSSMQPSMLDQIDWIEDPVLQDAWRASMVVDGWNISALDLCDRVGIPTDRNFEPWIDVRLSLLVKVRTRYENGLRYLNRSDMVAVLRKEAAVQRCSIEVLETLERYMKTYLVSGTGSDYLPEKTYSRLHRIIDREVKPFRPHSLPFQALDGAPVDKGASVTECNERARISFTVRHYRPAKIFNLTQLLSVIQPEDRHRVDTFFSNVSDYHDLRGAPSLEGIYVPSGSFETIATELGVGVSDLKRQTSLYSGEQRDFSGYKLQDWILLCLGTSTSPIPLERATKMVVHEGRKIAVNEFFTKYCPKAVSDEWLARMDHAPEFYQPRIPQSVQGLTMTYKNTTSSEASDYGRFRFKRARLSVSGDHDRTSQWVESSDTRVTKKIIEEVMKDPSG